MYAVQRPQCVLGRRKTLPDHPPDEYWRFGVVWATFGAQIGQKAPTAGLITLVNLNTNAICAVQRPQGTLGRRKTLPAHARDKY